MVQWEYDFVQMHHEGPYLDFGELLRKFQLASQELGKQGWELVSVLHLQNGYQGFFKRAKFTRDQVANIGHDKRRTE